MARHSPSGFSNRVQNSWFHLLWQLIQFLKLHSSPRPSHYHHHVWLLVWCSFYEMLCFGLCGCTPDVTGHTPFKKFNFCLISPQNICPKVLRIIKIFLFGKCETSFCVFLVSSGFCLGKIPWMLFLHSLFLLVESWTTDLNWGEWGLQFFRCYFRFFYYLLDESSLRSLGLILVGMPLLGRFTTVSSFLLLWIMALTMVRWSPKALEMAI